ncbi:ferric iron uptake transcriptional regulator [Halorhodospira halochloris]|uniref:ferric iron uptake transcriptional regulator n=1 Tax=Halorhodospira halochloris TaxID=1052 RepID=UPI001EE8BB68|nr:ferric iron uptake transcriptional regulator [Halorhodospira halochloris]MCG5547696.1 ferric iron uptake transcriptional regulator [Halorhodospira halochloris]
MKGGAVDASGLRKAGLKVTLPRMKILEILEQSRRRHVSAEDVYRSLLDAGEDIGLATVYRVLTQFENVGIVVRHNFQGNHSVFELNDINHHDHIVCTNCGRVEEFVDDTIEKRQRETANGCDFRMTGHSLILYGLCAECREDGETEESTADTAYYER